MKAYGEPDYIVAVEEPAFSWYILSIIYKQKGFIIRKETRNSFSLDKDTYFDELIFSDDPIKDGLARFDAKLINTWKGLRSFNFYCHLEDGQSCK